MAFVAALLVYLETEQLATQQTVADAIGGGSTVRPSHTAGITAPRLTPPLRYSTAPCSHPDRHTYRRWWQIPSLVGPDSQPFMRFTTLLVLFITYLAKYPTPTPRLPGHSKKKKLWSFKY